MRLKQGLVELPPETDIVSFVEQGGQAPPGARQLVRERRRNAQKGQGVFWSIAFWGSDFLGPIDQNARTGNERVRLTHLGAK